MADFLGVSNLMDSENAAGATGSGQGEARSAPSDSPAGQGDIDASGNVKIVIRPERIGLEEQGSVGENRVPGMVERVVYVGSIMQVIVHLAPGQSLQAWVQNQGKALPYRQGTPVTVHFPREALRVLIDQRTAIARTDDVDAGATVCDASPDHNSEADELLRRAFPRCPRPLDAVLGIGQTPSPDTPRRADTSISVAAAFTAGVGAARAAS